MIRRPLAGRSFAGPGAEAGFLLVEAVMATALVAICAGAALAAVAAVTHATANAAASASLSRTARNVLTDLRAATAYDADALAGAAGKSVSFDATEPAADGSPRTVHVRASVSRIAGTGRYLATVSASAAGAAAVSVQATLAQEAPAPGAILPAAAPARSTAAPAGAAPGPIPL